MSTERITKSFLFYVIPLCLLFSYFFTTCYGDELDIIDDRLNEIEARLGEIEQKIKDGWVVKSIVDKPNTDGKPGFEITLVDGNGSETKWWIYAGADGVNGATGAPGRDASRWYVKDGTWWSVNWDGSETNSYIPANKDSKAPVVEHGHWVFYEWNSTTNGYDTIRTSYVADSLSTHIVDMGEHYILYVPIEDKTPEGQIIYNGDGTIHMIYAEIMLPKWAQSPTGPVYFKIIGYAEIEADTARLLDDGTVDLYWDYWHINLQNKTENLAVQPGDEKWKWNWVDTLFADMSVDKYTIPTLKEKEIAVVFSLNRPQSYLDTATIGLYDSQDRKLEIIALDPAQPLSQILTKTKGSGSNGDTLYYARLRTETAILIPPSAVQKSRVYYRLVAENGDNLRSELSASTIGLKYQTIASKAVVQKVAGFGVIPPDTFLVHARDTNNFEFSPLDSVKIFDYYIDSLRGGGHLPFVTFGDSTAGYQNYKTFTVDSPQTPAGDPYHFRLNVYKLQKDGSVYIDTIRIKAVY